MSGEISKPSRAQYWVAHGPGVLHQGVTDVVHVTTTGQPNFSFFDDEQGLLASMVGLARIPSLPSVGEEVEEGIVYDHQGALFRSRQFHVRMNRDPSLDPHLFSTARQPGIYQDWVVGEQVYVGDIRVVNATEYDCIVSHITRTSPAADPTRWSQRR